MGNTTLDKAIDLTQTCFMFMGLALRKQIKNIILKQPVQQINARFGKIFQSFFCISYNRGYMAQYQLQPSLNTPTCKSLHQTMPRKRRENIILSMPRIDKRLK